MPFEFGIRAQLIISGEGGPSNEAGGDGIMMHHVYAACLPPYALGLPAHHVQLYCGPFFLGHKDKKDFTRLQVPIGTKMPNMDEIFVGTAELEEGLFDYFWDIFQRSQPLQKGVRLPKCEIRIISGHCCTQGSEAFVLCGAQVPFRDLEVVDKGQRNASVLPVLDGCLSPQAVHALKDPKLNTFVAGEDVFRNVEFPIVCSTATKSFCFRLSWDGHHRVQDKKDPKFNPRGYPDMSHPIGFPVICSLMVAVKARYVDKREDLDLGGLFQEQFELIQRRYYAPGRPFSREKTPYHNLGNFQKLLDQGSLEVNEDALNCLLYNRNREWFTTTELETSLLPEGDESAELAGDIALFVRQEVMKWHAKRKGKQIWDRSDASEWAWRRLSKAMSFHSCKLHEFTLQVSGEYIVATPNEYNDDMISFKDWATGCESLPDIVDKVVDYLEFNEGKTLWEHAGVEHGQTECISVDEVAAKQ